MAADAKIVQAFESAKQQYAALGVDVDEAMRTLASIPISLHCWQGDDVGGFESDEGLTGGGIQATGNYPGKARTGDELRADLDQAYSIIPGKHRLNLEWNGMEWNGMEWNGMEWNGMEWNGMESLSLFFHALYAEPSGKKVERDALEPSHFSRWVDWAKSVKIGMDFNPSYFSHPKANDGFTLASRDEGIRKFWVQHGKVCRRIGAHFGRELKSACVTNVWIPDGYKDSPADRKTPREILTRSLDEVFAEPIDPKLNLDAVEGKLFGIGSESYVVGSHEFYLGYAIRNQKLLCLDAGHFHPTEGIADKISSVMCYLPEILLHVSRGVRWDSDHVVTLSDDLRATAEELVRGDYLKRTHIGLDYFDASINRVAAWAIGTRCMIKALLIALLEPTAKLRELEISGDFTSRLAMMEEVKTMPVGAVWDHYCQTQNVPVGRAWLDQIKSYERDVLSKRC